MQEIRGKKGACGELRAELVLERLLRGEGDTLPASLEGGGKGRAEKSGRSYAGERTWTPCGRPWREEEWACGEVRAELRWRVELGTLRVSLERGGKGRAEK